MNKLITTWAEVEPIQTGEVYVVDLDALGTKHNSPFRYSVEKAGYGAAARFASKEHAMLFASQLQGVSHEQKR